ncbi:MAG: DUF2190 family protein [Clostridia bacterium]|nr:DUF2190 family protein [Clostridia bacterium]
MANEFTKVELFGENRDGDQVSYTVASSAVIPKGSLLTLSDPFTVSLCAADGAPIAGIAAEEHNGTDFSTKMSVYTNGIFNGVASGAIPVGAPLMSAAGTAAFKNYVMVAGTLDVASGAQILGYSRETAAAGETFNVRLRL